MADQSDTIRSVAWSEVFPWLMILRAVQLATSVPALFVATIGFLLMSLGWWGARQILDEEGDFLKPTKARAVSVHHSAPEMRLAQLWEARQDSPFEDLTPRWQGFTASDFFLPMLHTYGSLVEPLRRAAHPNVPWPELFFWLLVGTWNLLVWSICGGTITRMAVMQYGRGEREGLVYALRFMRRRWAALVGTPFFALSGVLCAVLLCIPVGWIMEWELGTLFSAFIWIFVLIGGVTTTIFLLGLYFGWPLICGALSTEEMGDIFEGAQRCYSYLFGRPIHYACYGLIAIVVGSGIFHVMQYLARLVVSFGYWAVTWAGGVSVLQVSFQNDGLGGIGGTIIAALNTGVLLAGTAFCYSFLFSSAGVIYLLLRRNADQIELDVVHAPEQHIRFGLPALESDAAGVPGVQDSTGA